MKKFDRQGCDSMSRQATIQSIIVGILPIATYKKLLIALTKPRGPRLESISRSIYLPTV